MSNPSQPFSPKRRTFCASTLGFVALGPLSLAGCGSGDSTSDTAPRAPQRLAGVATGPAFVHPGLLHTQADFNRMSQKVGARVSPWIDDWNLMLQNNLASNTWQPDPRPVIYQIGRASCRERV